VSDSTARRALGRCDSAASVNSNSSLPGFHFDRSDTSEQHSTAGTGAAGTSTATAAAAAVAAVAALNNSDPSQQQQLQLGVQYGSDCDSGNGPASSVASAGSVSPGGLKGGEKEGQRGGGPWQVVQRQGTRRKQVGTAYQISSKPFCSIVGHCQVVAVVLADSVQLASTMVLLSCVFIALL
jgi:hypothetical protein